MVLRSTTPCVAVNSRSSSILLTVISIVLRGNSSLHRHKAISPEPCYFCYFLISNAKPIKPAVTVGAAQKWKSWPTRLLSPLSSRTLDVRNRSRTLRSDLLNLAATSDFCRALHSFHIAFTAVIQGRLDCKVENDNLAAVYPPNCSVNLLSSLFKSLSFFRTSSIFSTECSTVV